MSNIIVTGEVRLSYVNVFNPRQSQSGGEPKYSVTILLPKSDIATKQAIDAEIQRTLTEAAATTFGGQMPASPAIPVYDGDGVRPSGEPFGEECRGHWVFTASSQIKPEVVDANVQPILSQSQVYSGCYGRVSIRFFAYNKAGRKGVGCGLGNVQKLHDGEPLGGGTTAKQDFGAIATQQTSAAYSQPAYNQPAQNYQQQYTMPVQQPQTYQPTAAPQGNPYGFLGM